MYVQCTCMCLLNVEWKPHHFQRWYQNGRKRTTYITCTNAKPCCTPIEHYIDLGQGSNEFDNEQSWPTIKVNIENGQVFKPDESKASLCARRVLALQRKFLQKKWPQFEVIIHVGCDQISSLISRFIRMLCSLCVLICTSIILSFAY